MSLRREAGHDTPSDALRPPSSPVAAAEYIRTVVATSSLSSLHCAFVSEHAVLEAVIYKNRNPHRRATYFRRLVQLQRLNRRIDLAALQESLQQAPAAAPSSSSPVPAVLPAAIDDLRRCLSAVVRAADPLYSLLQQTYFMPFALTSLAVLARLLVVVKAALLLLLTVAREREENARVVQLFARNSVALSLLAALKEPKGELVVLQLDGRALHEPCEPQSTARPTSRAEAAPVRGAPRIPSPEDIPFFDDEDDTRCSPSVPPSPSPHLPPPSTEADVYEQPHNRRPPTSPRDSSEVGSRHGPLSAELQRAGKAPESDREASPSERRRTATVSEFSAMSRPAVLLHPPSLPLADATPPLGQLVLGKGARKHRASHAADPASLHSRPVEDAYVPQSAASGQHRPISLIPAKPATPSAPPAPVGQSLINAGSSKKKEEEEDARRDRCNLRWLTMRETLSCTALRPFI